MSTKKILIIGNGYIADNFTFYIKDIHDITVYARTKHVEYNNVTYIYDLVEHIDSIENIYDNIFILFGRSRPDNISLLNEVIYPNVYLVSKILDFAKKNNSKIFYPATSLALSETIKNLTYYSYSHSIAIDMIKNFNLTYTICYLHNIYGSLTGSFKKNKMVIDHFMDSYFNNRPIQLINAGIQKRIFTHILDVVKYMADSLDNSITEVNLVKNNQMYSVKEIADIFGIQTISVQNTLYSTEDPCITYIDSTGEWNESINIKQWILNNIKI